MPRIPRRLALRRLTRRHVEPGIQLDTLEPRQLLSSFLYHDLGAFLSPAEAIYVLRPLGDNAPPRTIGSSVDAAGDVNADGFADIIAGAGGVVPGNSDTERAVAVLYSGASGRALFTFSDGFSEFGVSVAGIGDVNGDGRPDVIVGSPRFDPDVQGGSRQIGRAYIYSGADGSLIRSITGENAGDRFGASVASAGDFNNDGTADVIVGAAGADAGGNNRGRAYVISGVDGSMLAVLTGLTDDDALGYSVAGAGDVNADGYSEVIVGAPGRFSGPDRTPGHAHVYSGQTHSSIFAFEGDFDGDRFGFAVDGAGDVNGDGHPDLLVGAPNADNDSNGHIPAAGAARVYSGSSGAVLYTLRGDAPNGNLGAALAGAGDLNGDGRGDFLVAAPSATRQSNVGVYSGIDGSILVRFVADEVNLEASDRLSTSVAVVGDVDGDGFTDFVFTGTQDANPERNDRARMYVFSGVRAAGLRPEGFNDDRDIWGTASGEGFLALNGDLFRLTTRQGFVSGDRVIDVNSHDSVLGRAADGTTFRWTGGTRTTLGQLIQQESGPAGPYIATRAVDLTDSGLVLVQRWRDDTTSSTWLLENGTLTYLMEGEPVAMNEARAVIAINTGVTTTRLWTPSGGLLVIPDLYAIDLNENTTIVGTAPDPADRMSIRTLIWNSGTVTNIGVVSGGDDFVPTGINNDGQVIGTYTIVHNGATAGYFYTPGIGIMNIRECLSGADAQRFDATRQVSLVDINNRGWVIGTLNARDGFLLEPFGGDGPFRAEAGGAVVGSLSLDGVLSVVFVNQAGEIVLFQRDSQSGPWTSIDLSVAAGTQTADEVVAFRDGRNGGINAYAAVTSTGVLLISRTDSGTWSVRNLTDEIPGATRIDRALVQFTTGEDYITLAGLSDSGDLLIYGQTAQRDPQGRVVWAFNNLSETQLAPRGIATPAFVGRPTAYVTTWNGQNIAGVDAAGDIQVVWTAPGLGGWTATNLTTQTGAPALAGGLTAYITSWGGINLAGNDTFGHTVVTWWVPGFGGEWRHNDFTSEFGGPGLRASSMTSYVTPWGGLNLAGLTDDGQVVVYWWVPGFTAWRIAPLSPAGSDRRDTPIRRLTSIAGDDGSVNILTTGIYGDVLRYHWRPDAQWQIENLTTLTQ